MKLWLISQKQNTGRDTYDAAVVCAETADEARKIHPSGWLYDDDYSDWAPPGSVSVKLIGEAAETVKPGVVLSSFNECALPFIPIRPNLARIVGVGDRPDPVKSGDPHAVNEEADPKAGPDDGD